MALTIQQVVYEFPQEQNHKSSRVVAKSENHEQLGCKKQSFHWTDLEYRYDCKNMKTDHKPNMQWIAGKLVQ